MAPQSRAIPVLVTRPEPQAARTAADLAERFGDRVRPVLSPLMAVVYHDPVLPEGPFDGLILTSESAVTAVERYLKAGASLPRLAYCVGRHTAQCAEEIGLGAVSAEGDAADLVQVIAAALPQGRLLHVAGRDRRGDVAGELGRLGIEVETVVAYAQEPQPLTAEARAVLQAADRVLVPLFSPRSARLFVTAVAAAEVRADLILFALSPAVAAELRDVRAEGPHVAARPNWPDLAETMSRVVFKG